MGGILFCDFFVFCCFLVLFGCFFLFCTHASRTPTSTIGVPSGRFGLVRLIEIVFGLAVGMGFSFLCAGVGNNEL